MRTAAEGIRQVLEASGLSGVLSSEVASAAIAIQLRPGQRVLTQGEPNERLYLLIAGSLAVLVDGERVARLDRRGDLIGEMSVISGRPCSATVIAETDAELLAIPSVSRTGATAEPLFGLVARVLAGKLEVTNEKAKQVERINTELSWAHVALRQANNELEQRIAERTADLVQKTQLLEAQNAELGASQRRMEDLFRDKQGTLERLGVLRDGLGPLRAALAQAARAEDPALARAAADAELEVGRVLGALEPLTRQRSAAAAMRDRRVLLAHSDRKLQRTAKVALLGTGVTLDLPADLAACERLADAHAYDVVCTDAAHIACAARARATHPDASIVFLTTEGVAASLAQLREQPAISSIVATDLEDRTSTVKSILTTVTKLLTRDVFGLDKYLSWGVEVRERRVHRSDERAGRLDEMETHLRGLGVRQRVVARAVQAAEELMMNAIYDAPVGPDGAPLFNHLPRTTAVELPGQDVVTLRYASDGLLLAISVEDPYGRLDRGTILEYLESCYGGRAGTLNQEGKKGGAGRGLFLVSEVSDLVVFNVEERRRTEVVAVWSLAEPQPGAATSSSLQIFALPAAGPPTPSLR